MVNQVERFVEIYDKFKKGIDNICEVLQEAGIETSPEKGFESISATVHDTVKEEIMGVPVGQAVILDEESLLPYYDVPTINCAPGTAYKISGVYGKNRQPFSAYNTAIDLANFGLSGGGVMTYVKTNKGNEIVQIYDKLSMGLKNTVVLEFPSLGDGYTVDLAIVDKYKAEGQGMLSVDENSAGLVPLSSGGSDSGRPNIQNLVIDSLVDCESGVNLLSNILQFPAIWDSPPIATITTLGLQLGKTYSMSGYMGAETMEAYQTGTPFTLEAVAQDQSESSLANGVTVKDDNFASIVLGGSCIEYPFAIKKIEPVETVATLDGTLEYVPSLLSGGYVYDNANYTLGEVTSGSKYVLHYAIGGEPSTTECYIHKKTVNGVEFYSASMFDSANAEQSIQIKEDGTNSLWLMAIFGANLKDILAGTPVATTGASIGLVLDDEREDTTNIPKVEIFAFEKFVEAKKEATAVSSDCEIYLSDLTPTLTEIEGMPVSLIVNQFPIPEFLKNDVPGRITTIYNSVETEYEMEEGTLKDLGSDLTTPTYMTNDETYTPTGNPYLYVIVLAPGAAVSSFNPATGEINAAEDSDILSIIGYCIEQDSEGNPIQPSWYFDSLKVYAITTEQLLAKKDSAWIKGSFDASFEVPEDARDYRGYCFASSTFEGAFTVPKNPDYIDEGVFMGATFRKGLYFEEGGVWGLSLNAFKNTHASYVETPIQVITVSENYPNLGTSVFEGTHMPYVRVNIPSAESVGANALRSAELYSINSDEQGTFYLSSTSEADVSGYISKDAFSYVQAKKLILDYPNYELSSAYRLWEGYWTSLEELRINVSPNSTGELILGYSSVGDSSINTPIKVVCPNIVFSHTEGVFAYGAGHWFLNRVTYLDCRSPWIYTRTPSNGTFPSYAKTLVFRETEGIIKGLENVWHYELESLYVPDELLASYQEYYTNCQDTLGVRDMLLAALKPLSELPEEV